MKHHRSLRQFLLALIAFACLGCASQASAQQQTLTDAEVDAAIQGIKDFFYASQDPATGGWYGQFHTGPQAAADKNSWGPTAMAVLALIVSGESPQRAEIAKALELLAEVEIQGVYAMSMRIHVWSYLPQETFGGLLERDTAAIYRSWYGFSRFGYPIAPYGATFNDNHVRGGEPINGGRVDNSTTQYGILAMWQASKRGANIPNVFWEQAIANFIEQQQADGGWAYSGARNTSQSMTLAGLACMYVAQQELFRNQPMPNELVATSIQQGLQYLDRNFNPGQGNHGGSSYMWYGYERIGLASGRKYFGEHDWFQEIAHAIVRKNGRYGSEIHTAAFDLMFLARGRVPVWINKLEVPGANWNNRPNDVYFLNRYISEYREHEVNWQVVSVDTNPEEWISAPLMWVSSNQEIEWTDDQVAKIKEYIDLGGTLIANSEGASRSGSFRASIVSLAQRMYPDLSFAPMAEDNPMANLLEGDSRRRSRPPLEVLSNGARVLIVMPTADWGMTFQADENPNPDTSEAWRYITNIYGVATDRGQLTPRLSSPMVQRTPGRADTGTIKIVIPEWEDPAGALAETDVYRVMRNFMHNETGKQLVVERVPLAQLSTVDPSLLHLVGVDPVQVSPAERDAIQAYINAGGTVLIENLGGRGGFADSMREQLGAMFATGRSESRVLASNNLISGVNLPEGSRNARPIIYRRMVLTSNPDSRLLLRGYGTDERFPVLVSYEDLSLGMLGVRHYGINGYSTQTSRNLMINILLEAQRAHPGS